MKKPQRCCKANTAQGLNKVLLYQVSNERSWAKDFTRDGECSHCGNCCSNLLPLSKREVRKIDHYIKVNNIKELKPLVFLKSGVDAELFCPFYDTSKKDKHCAIYPVRPDICKYFTCRDFKHGKFNKRLLKEERMLIDMRDIFFNEGEDGKG